MKQNKKSKSQAVIFISFMAPDCFVNREIKPNNKPASQSLSLLRQKCLTAH